ncbi:MAG: macro domain-containing protein [Anaerolineae bacterium]|jgi:hypothetical protein|nr:macro domain-containing protein [Anaerolineae bacterium]
MILYVADDLFQSPAKVLVNAVNTVGVMNHGNAADFKRFYPTMFAHYQALCDREQLTIGRLFLHQTAHKWVLNVPIKAHWREKATLQAIESGLQKFVSIYAEYGITSASFPTLGSEDLSWETEIRPLMEAYLDPLPIITYVHHYDSGAAASRNTRAIAAWLSQSPQAIAFEQFWRDLVQQIKRRTTYQTEQGDEFQVGQDSKTRAKHLVISRDGHSSFFSESMLADLWSYLGEAGYCLPRNLPVHAAELITLLSTLPYLRPVALATVGGAMHTGLHYIPMGRGNQTHRVQL